LAEFEQDGAHLSASNRQHLQVCPATPSVIAGSVAARACGRSLRSPIFPALSPCTLANPLPGASLVGGCLLRSFRRRRPPPAAGRLCRRFGCVGPIRVSPTGAGLAAGGYAASRKPNARTCSPLVANRRAVPLR
jgi:hypothetical protein